MEEQAQAVGFWENPPVAVNVVKEINLRRREIELFARLEVEIKALREVLAIDKTADMSSRLKTVELGLLEFEQRSRMTGAMDANDAIVVVSGEPDERKTWIEVERFRRAFKNVVQQRGYKFRCLWVDEREEGICAVSILIEGRYAYGRFKESASSKWTADGK